MTRRPRIKKSRWLPPYVSGREPAFMQYGKTTFEETRLRSGVYFIKDERGKLVYIGKSEKDLYRTLYRHFQKWNHPFQEVVTYRGRDLSLFRVRVILCSPKRATRLETHFLLEHNPPDNIEKIAALSADQSTAADRQAVNAAKIEPVDLDDPF